MADGLARGTNATLLQVAAGVLAGWSALGQQQGVHLADETDWRAMLRVAESILGSVRLEHAPESPALTLSERRVTDPLAEPEPVAAAAAGVS